VYELGPPPIPSAVSAPHWEAASRGVLSVQRCSKCERYAFPPGLACPYCGSHDQRWVPCSGRGIVHTFTTVHRAPTPGVATPYVVAVVELEEGWHMMTNIVGCAPQDVSIDMPVRVIFQQISPDIALPKFELDLRVGDANGS
jgi:uncharacterized protein